MSQRADRVASRSDAKRVITSLKQELDASYLRYIEALTVVPINFQGETHGFMCVRLSGFLEQVVFNSVTGTLKEYGDAGSYALTYFNRSPNLTPDALVKIIARFGHSHEERISNFLEQGGRRESLGLLLSVRNKAAHGENYNGSRPSVENYKRLCDEIANWFINEYL